MTIQLIIIKKKKINFVNIFHIFLRYSVFFGFFKQYLKYIKKWLSAISTSDFLRKIILVDEYWANLKSRTQCVFVCHKKKNTSIHSLISQNLQNDIYFKYFFKFLTWVSQIWLYFELNHVKTSQKFLYQTKFIVYNNLLL